eukprot:TRINITY_DN21_c0_g1_i2.p1 TRINITY_DN21_c0_g1~~TRINITY_DN21_c0_g1_i2.p1  ORF type:complete len:988 (+),score=359.83 TRINITY_DN21_c0_g1_i2:125-3088(+)
MTQHDKVPDDDQSDFDPHFNPETLVPGRSSVYSLVAIAISVVGFIAFFSLTLRAGLNYERVEDRGGPGYRWIGRVDKFNIQEVAIEKRYFFEYGWHPAISTPIADNHVRAPFEDRTCLCSSSKFRNLDTSRREYCQNASVAAALYRIENGGREYPACTFVVPYAPVFAALACACCGFIAVAVNCRNVLLEPRGTEAMSELGARIAKASMVFMREEYKWLLPFVFALWLFLFLAVDGQDHGWRADTSASFVLGALLSGSCGLLGMHLATEGNVRTATACALAHYSGGDGLTAGLKVAFRTGACMGLAVVSFGMFGLALSYSIFGNTLAMGGFGFGASAVALFARVGGGIYTKAADVGGDLCGKVESQLDEDNPKNPATIADCVGDNVGDTAGMGADLFESFVGTVVAACVLGAAEFGERGVGLPFYIACIGLIASIIGSSYIHIPKGKGGQTGLDELLLALSLNVIVTGVLVVTGVFILCFFYLRDETGFLEDTDASMRQSQPGARVAGCVLLGLVAGVFIGKVTEYFTSHTFQPTQSIARAGEFGPGPVVIQGIGMGMYSTVVPMTLIVSTILGSFYMAGLYGTAIACVGMLSTLGVTMSTDAYGPVSDNAGGIVEMCELNDVRPLTDKLDALGNTTAATGKGFANGSAVLAAVSLLAAYTRSANLQTIDLLKPIVVCGLLLGALQPYVFAAMTMLSVNKAAQEMMAEVRRQFDELKDAKGRRILDPEYDGDMPDYDRCIAISTKSALKEMLLPGIISIFCPLIVGFVLGASALAGFLMGAISTGYLLGVQMSNSGGAWDNAKKYVEAEELKLRGLTRKKKTMEHAAVVAGDTVGDPFKDTSGPSLNILIKLMTQFSFVIAPLLGREWEHFWVGIVLASGAIIIVLFVKCYLLYTPPEKEDEHYDTKDGVFEQLDFLDSLNRRMTGDVANVAKQRKSLEDAEVDVYENSSGDLGGVWDEWAKRQGVACLARDQGKDPSPVGEYEQSK